MRVILKFRGINMYNTKQRQVLINFLENNINKQLSAREISDSICNTNNIGKSTVYRLIDKMVDEGLMRRFRGENAKSVVYQYVGVNNKCESHFHLKCTGCGLLIHLDCDKMDKLNQHINSHHRFSIDTSKTVLYGLCEQCNAGE